MVQYRAPGMGGTPPVVKNLLILNVLMYLITVVVKSSLGTDLNEILGMYYFKSEHFRPYQIATHMFMHGSFMHLFFNMFALWMFGRVLEMVWGGKRFLFYFFVTGLGAITLHTFVNWIEISSMQRAAEAFIQSPTPDLFSSFISKYGSSLGRQIYDFITSWSLEPENGDMAREAVAFVESFVKRITDVPTVGASGAVFGVLLAFGMLFPNTQLMLLFPPIPIKAKWLVIGYGLLEIYLGFTQPGSNIAHFAHIGGMLFGFFLIKYWNKKRNTFY